MRTPAGGNVEFDLDPQRPINSSVEYADATGSHMLGGQISWSPIFESINGTIVFDGSVVPPLGLVEHPIELCVKKGVIEKVTGAEDARTYENWLKSFEHKQMLRIAHVCYGYNPGAKLTGNILEDERGWSATEWV